MEIENHGSVEVSGFRRSKFLPVGRGSCNRMPPGNTTRISLLGKHVGRNRLLNTLIETVKGVCFKTCHLQYRRWPSIRYCLDEGAGLVFYFSDPASPLRSRNSSWISSAAPGAREPMKHDGISIDFSGFVRYTIPFTGPMSEDGPRCCLYFRFQGLVARELIDEARMEIDSLAPLGLRLIPWFLGVIRSPPCQAAFRCGWSISFAVYRQILQAMSRYRVTGELQNSIV